MASTAFDCSLVSIANKYNFAFRWKQFWFHNPLQFGVTLMHQILNKFKPLNVNSEFIFTKFIKDFQYFVFEYENVFRQVCT